VIDNKQMTNNKNQNGAHGAEKQLALSQREVYVSSSQVWRRVAQRDDFEQEDDNLSRYSKRMVAGNDRIVIRGSARALCVVMVQMSSTMVRGQQSMFVEVEEAMCFLDLIK
jgi:hypothetical protein